MMRQQVFRQGRSHNRPNHQPARSRIIVGLLLCLLGMAAPAGRVAATGRTVVGSGLYNETIYVGSADHYIYALNGHTGDKLWTFATNGAVWAAPTVAGGAVYVGSADHNVYAIDAQSGTLRWRFSTGAWVWSTPLVVSGTVYIGSRDGNVYALAARNGTKLWSFHTGGAVVSSPAASGGTLYIGSDDHKLYALDRRTGTLLWSFTTGRDVVSSPTVSGGSVYIGSDDGNIYALDARSGAEQWSFTTGGAVESPLTMGQGTVYAGSDDGSVYALDAHSGAKLWSFATKGWIVSAPVASGGDVYVGSLDHSIYAIDARTGENVWSYPTQGQIWSSPAVVRGVVYAGSLDRTIYALNTRTGQALWTAQANDAVYSPVAVLEQPTPAAPAAPVRGARFFSQTQHNLSGPFLAFYSRYGGVGVFGYPRSEPFNENGHLVQETDRFLLELVGHQVTTAPLGRILLQNMNIQPATPLYTGTLILSSFPSTTTKLYFASTQHSLSGRFLTYWKTHNGPALLGAPITEVFVDMNGDGSHRTYPMQWFERGRVEYHRELAGTPFAMELGLAGKEDLVRRGWTP